MKDQRENNNNRNSLLRKFRKMHRFTASLLFVAFFLISITGLLLGLKKHSNGWLQVKSIQGTSTNLAEWLPLDSLHANACKFLHDSVSSELSLELDRIDIRNKKGIVKFVFANHYWGIHLDGVTGQLIQIERRRSDFIEHLHDGSIVDRYLKTSNGLFKLVYMIIMGVALLLFTVTGFWLWYGPIWIKGRNNNSKQ